MFDLHFHSLRSDGANTQEQILDRAAELGLEYVAITDHDIITSDEFKKGAGNRGIDTCSSVEISARNYEHNKSLHLTCYADNFSQNVHDVLADVLDQKQLVIKRQVEILQEQGLEIDYDAFVAFNAQRGKDISTLNKFNTVEYALQNERNRQKLSKELGKDISFMTEGEVFRNIAKRGGKLYDVYGLPHDGSIPEYEPGLDVCREVQKQHNAILSIAHPNFTFRSGGIEQFNQVLPYYVYHGVNAVEINSKADEKWLQAIYEAKQRFDLILTAGSDNHGIGMVDDKHGDFGNLNRLLSVSQKREILDTFRYKLA